MCGQQFIYLHDSSNIRVLGKHMALFEDSTASLTIEEVAAPGFSTHFRPGTAEIPNYNVTRSRIWSRLQLVNRSGQGRWYLECGNPNVNSVEVFWQNSAGK